MRPKLPHCTWTTLWTVDSSPHRGRKSLCEGHEGDHQDLWRRAASCAEPPWDLCDGLLGVTFHPASTSGVSPQLNAVDEPSADSAGDEFEAGTDVPADSAGAEALDEAVDMEIGEEQRKAIIRREPHQPTQAEVEEHEATGQVVHRSWCLHCKRARVTADRHAHGESDEDETQMPTLSLDCFYTNQDVDEATLPSIVVKCHKTKWFWAMVLPKKGDEQFAVSWLGGVLDDSGFNKVLLKSVGEPSSVTLKQRVKELKTHIQVHLAETPVDEARANPKSRKLVILLI